MNQVLRMTHDEKVKVYKKIKKDELIKMLISANDTIDSLRDYAGELIERL